MAPAVRPPTTASSSRALLLASDPAPEPPGRPAAPGSGHLDRSLVRGIAWTTAARWGSQILSWISTFLVARILSPDDYGLVGMATVYLGLVKLLSEFGIGTAVVTLRDLDRAQVAQLHGLSVLFGLGGAALSCALALPLGWFFEAPRLPAVIAAMSLAFPLAALRTVPYGLLQKQLRFKLLAAVDAAEAVVAAVTVLLLALAGLGYWALVAGWVLAAAASTALTLGRCTHPVAWPRRGPLRQAIAFSTHVIGSRLAWYAYSNSDFLVAGRVLGQRALGFYTFAWTFASVPVDKVTAVLLRLTPAVFAAVQTEARELRRYLLRLTEGLALLTFPATVGLALVADDFVLLALGEQWARAAAPLRILAFYAAFRSVVPLLPQMLNVVGEARYVMLNSVVAALTMPFAFWAGSRAAGIAGIAAAWMAVHPLVTAALFRRLMRRIDLTLGAYLRALAPALSATAAMAAAVFAARFAGAAALPLAARFAAEVLAGAAGFALTLATVHRRRLRDFREFLRLLRRQADRPGPAGPPLGMEPAP